MHLRRHFFLSRENTNPFHIWPFLLIAGVVKVDLPLFYLEYKTYKQYLMHDAVSL